MIDTDKLKEAAEPVYDSPHNSEWIVGIDAWGCVFVLKAPNIHFSFFDNAHNAECIGIPFEMPEEKAGVYKMRCSYHELTDWESGIVDDYEFHCEELTKVLEYI